MNKDRLSVRCSNVMEILLKQGRKDFEPISYPARYGMAWEAHLNDLTLRFDMEGRIKEVMLESTQELLRRTMTHRWIFYEWTHYDQNLALTGAYYLPKNHGEPLSDTIKSRLDEAIKRLQTDQAVNPKVFIQDITTLKTVAERIKKLLGIPISVLPPETFWINYEILPIIIAEGCLYGCRFCNVKGPLLYKIRTKNEIKGQIMELTKIYGQERINLGGIFLGQNDALATEGDFLLYGADMAWEAILSHSIRTVKDLYLFASPTSFLCCTSYLIESLNKLPYGQIHINIGLESPCKDTLKQLGKPIDEAMIQDVVQKATALNNETNKIAVSLNLLVSPHLSKSHKDAIEEFLSLQLKKARKGAVFLSPLILPTDSDIGCPSIKREILRLKAISKWPLYLYLIQPF